jgi:hypothetical protein
MFSSIPTAAESLDFLLEKFFGLGRMYQRLCLWKLRKKPGAEWRKQETQMREVYPSRLRMRPNPNPNPTTIECCAGVFAWDLWSFALALHCRDVEIGRGCRAAGRKITSLCPCIVSLTDSSWKWTSRRWIGVLRPLDGEESSSVRGASVVQQTGAFSGPERPNGC